MLDKIIANYPVDKNRIYITGLSMGGHGTWDMIMRYPHFVAAPVCGWGDRRLVRSVKSLPKWIFHGAKDKTVPVIYTVELYEELQKAGNAN